MEAIWFLLFVFLLVELVLVTALCMPMPSNETRHKVTSFVASLRDAKPVQYTCYVILAVDVGYFWFVSDALLHPLYDFGILAPAVHMGITCEYKRDLFYNERNASITGAIIVLFFVLRRLVDIQGKLHAARAQVKALGGDAGGDAGSDAGYLIVDKKKDE